MKRDERNLFNTLKEMGAPVIERPEGDGDGAFVLSAEDNCNQIWADYWDQGYGEFGVDRVVCETAREHGFHCEWINPGIVGFYK